MSNPTTVTTAASHGERTCPDKNFPNRLYRFLNLVDKYDISHIASWQPHGRCFRIHNPKEFVKLSEPSWFVYSKYSSFQRQLNIYGFTRITHGSDKNCYYNEYFIRGKEHLLHKILRVPTKKDAPQQQSSSSSDNLIHAADSNVIPPALKEVVDSSTNAAVHTAATINLPTPATLHSRIQSQNDNASAGATPYLQSDADVQRRIELLQHTNRQHISEAMQQLSNHNRYRDLLLLNNNNNSSSNPHAPIASNDALILQLLQNQTSMSSATNALSLALSQFPPQVEAAVPIQNISFELLRHQLNLTSATAAQQQLPMGLSQNIQLRRPPQLDSLSTAHTTLASLIQQQRQNDLLSNNNLNVVRQLRYNADPILFNNQIPSVASAAAAGTRGIPHQLLEQQLIMRHEDDQRRLLAMSLLQRIPDDLLRSSSVTNPSGRPSISSDSNVNVTHPQLQSSRHQSSTADDQDELSPNSS